MAGLDFGLLVGLGTGILAFIPYVGAAIGLAVGTGLALSQFSDWPPTVLVVAVFLVGQTAESYFLTPRMVGSRVGLHPIWIIFSLLAGGALFGFTGVLLAVPVAAVIGVLVRFATGRYLESSLYSGGSSTKAK
jgi:predicted PurR-regulated permease PerM